VSTHRKCSARVWAKAQALFVGLLFYAEIDHSPKDRCDRSENIHFLKRFVLQYKVFALNPFLYLL
jgi:hypothetical protein